MTDTGCTGCCSACNVWAVACTDTKRLRVRTWCRDLRSAGISVCVPTLPGGGTRRGGGLTFGRVGPSHCVVECAAHHQQRKYRSPEAAVPDSLWSHPGLAHRMGRQLLHPKNGRTCSATSHAAVRIGQYRPCWRIEQLQHPACCIVQRVAGEGPHHISHTRPCINSDSAGFFQLLVYWIRACSRAPGR